MKCEPTEKRFLWWKWIVDGHRWIEVDWWRTPIDYGARLWTTYRCFDCKKEKTGFVDADGR